MTVKTKKYCFREPDFPKESYLALIFISNDDGVKFLYPMKLLYPNLKVLRNKIITFKKSLDKKGEVKLDGVIVVKIKFNKTYPLRKEHWISPEISLLNNDFRMKQFMVMMEDVYQFYQIIILPTAYKIKTKKWFFTNWIPIFISSDDNKIEGLIKASDQPVDQSAKSMGLYSIEKIKGFDLDTGKFVAPNKEIKTQEADC